MNESTEKSKDPMVMIHTSAMDAKRMNESLKVKSCVPETEGDPFTLAAQ